MSPDALALLQVRERAAARGYGLTMHPRTGVTRAGLVWVAMNRHEEFLHTGATLTDACAAWLASHPSPSGAS
jgi:hypothetical protein